MSPAERALQSRIERRAAALGPQARRKLFAAFDLIRAHLSEAELMRAGNNGTLELLIEELLSDKALDNHFSGLRSLIDRSTLDASSLWTRDLPPSFGGVFNILNPRVITAVVQLDTRVIQGLKEEVREAVREQVRLGLEAGKNPRVVATRIGSAIGLAPNQVRAVDNFRTQLESGDRAALRRMLGRGELKTSTGEIINRRGHAGGKGVSATDLRILNRTLGNGKLRPDQIDRMVNAYRNRLLAWNTETHSRTIALDTHRLAQRMSWQAAIDRGTVDASRLRKTWVTVGDDRVRPEHVKMQGEVVLWGQQWSNGEDIPGDSTYNCRCLERVTLLPANNMRMAA
jgi:hypothetical protein